MTLLSESVWIVEGLSSLIRGVVDTVEVFTLDNYFLDLVLEKHILIYV